MGRPFGIDALNKGLEDLSNEVTAYLGALAELRNNLPTQIPEKPIALIYTEQIQMTGKLLVSGALMDQPHIWMKEYKICVDLLQLFENQRRAQEQTKGK